ncbi:response regulator [bacterium]|nr:response regulator [bacterium]
MALILIIEDDAEARDVLRRGMIRAGHEVIEAANGAEGLKRLEQHEVDLVITDLIMPEKEGLETITEALEVYPDLKIIAISGGTRLGFDSYLKIARSLGAQRVYSKPVDLRELAGAVEELLANGA